MRLFICQRGTASVEIVVMLPVFIVLFCGAIYLHNLGLARQQASSAARACAFYYAVNGCTDEAAKHPICAGLKPHQGAALTADEAAQETKESHSVLDDVAQWPGVGVLVKGLFGQGSSAAATREVPGFMGSDDRKVEGRFYLVCNTVSQSWSGRAGELLCGAAGKLHIKSTLGHLGLCK